VATTLITHPIYTAFAASWKKAHDVYEGAGGFMDPDCPYLIPHPREWLDHSVKDASTGVMVPNPNPTQASPKLKMRRKLARYENVAAAIIETVVGALFKQAPARIFAKAPNERVKAFWADVDGHKTTIDTFMEDAWISAAVFGHAVLVLDKPKDVAATKADMQAPRLRRYTPLDVIDWLEDADKNITAVKLLEAAPRTEFGTTAQTVLDSACG
jgi:hypothetical protein